MLPRAHRLTRRTDFTDVVRGGRRAGRPLLTVHLSPAGPGRDASPDDQRDDRPEDQRDERDPGPPARAGLVVSRAVGGSVVRSRVARRLRHLLRDRLPALPPGTRVVVRAAPPAATADSAALGADLDAALARLVRGLPR